MRTSLGSLLAGAWCRAGLRLGVCMRNGIVGGATATVTVVATASFTAAAAVLAATDTATVLAHIAVLFSCPFFLSFANWHGGEQGANRNAAATILVYIINISMVILLSFVCKVTYSCSR